MVFDALHIPALQRKRVPVKAIIEQLHPTSDDKKLITSHVASIYLVSILNEQTIRFRAYKDDEYSYQTIYVFEITLKKNDSLKELSSLIHSSFPEPTLLLLNQKDKEYISAASKHINKLDTSKSVVDDVVLVNISKGYEYLNLSKVSARNLKEYYEMIIQILYKLFVYNLTNAYPISQFDYKEMIKEYNVINANINRLKVEYKQVSMKSEKMDIDDKIYDEEQKLNTLIKKLEAA